MTPGRGAVFFDRDGVLNRDVGYAFRPDQIDWCPDAREAVAAAGAAGLLVFVVTNQSGVARGFYDEESVLRLHAWMQAEFQKAGGRVDAFAYCPHHPEGVVAAYRQDCACRKPKPGMILDLAHRYGVTTSRAVMIGDHRRDGEAASAAGVDFLLYQEGSLLDLIAPSLSRLGVGAGREPEVGS